MTGNTATRISRIETEVRGLPLTRPYTIAFRTIDEVENCIVRVHSEGGLTGYGAASPEPHVTGETRESCRAALAEQSLAWLAGRDVRELGALSSQLEQRLPGNPAARAALDMALHDLLAQHLGVPLVEMLGRVHESLPTSITIGIMSVEEALEEAREYLGRGFHVLKVKLGHALDEDLARVARLRESLPADTTIRVDANQGYSAADVVRFMRESAPWRLEFLEQPMPPSQSMRDLPPGCRERIAADESLLDDADALELASSPAACGVFNIKLMKCGGIRTALRIAAIAKAADISLMWGCMDESRISIAAALHAALAAPATRYLDLDGSLDLGEDVAEGGFIIENGIMRTLPAPGLGVRAL